MTRSGANTEVQNKRILIVDDDKEFSGDLSFLLDGPYQIVSVSESKKAIQLLEKEKFDLVILDLKMPCFYGNEDETEGIEVLRIIRQKWGALRGVRIPVIILSKMDHQENQRKCVELEADEFFAKPPDIQALKKRIDECLTKTL